MHFCIKVSNMLQNSLLVAFLTWIYGYININVHISSAKISYMGYIILHGTFFYLKISYEHFSNKQHSFYDHNMLFCLFYIKFLTCYKKVLLILVYFAKWFRWKILNFFYGSDSIFPSNLKFISGWIVKEKDLKRYSVLALYFTHRWPAQLIIKKIK